MNGTFKPAKTVAKSHFAAMLARAFYPDEIAKFDTPETMKAYGTFGKTNMPLAANGALDNTSFRDTYLTEDAFLDINRYDMAQLITNIMNKAGFSAGAARKQTAIGKIQDYGQIPAQYKDAVANVYALGITGGYAGGSFKGEGIMNRGQAAVVIYRMMQLSGNAPENPPAAENPSAPETPEPPAQTPAPAGKTLANSQPITEDNVTAMLNELKAKYPEGTSFVNGYPAGANSADVRAAVNTYLNNRGYVYGTSTKAGCGGWTALVSDYIFGQTGFPARKVALTGARPGDIVITLNENGELEHAAIVTSRAWHDDFGEHTDINTTDAGTGGTGNKSAYSIYWTIGNAQWDNLQPGDWTIDVWTRYPE